MKSLIRPGGVAFAILLGLGLAPVAMGATPAGTDVSTTVTLDYQVGTVAQTQLTDTVTFEVDRLLNLDVQADTTPVMVTPGQAGAVLAFDVTNLGNDTQDVTLTVADVTTDDFDETTTIWIDDGNTTFEGAGTDTQQAYIDDLAPGAVVRVFVVADIGLANADGDIDGVHLVAQVAESAGTPGADITTDDSGNADNETGIDDVFADAVAGTATGDAALDGKHSDTAAFQVASASLTLTKTSAVIDDGIAGTSTNLKRIPGATVRYYLEVDNTGSVAAATLVLSDTFDADTTYVAGSLRREDDGTTDCDDATFTDAVDGDEASFDGTDTVEFTHATLGAGDSVTFCADVTIN